MGTHLSSLKSNLQKFNLFLNLTWETKKELWIWSSAPTKVTKSPNSLATRTARAETKARRPKKSAFVHDVIREVVGYTAYERRCIELLRISKDKRALKFCKKRLGSHTAAKRKREEMQNVIQAQKRAAKH